MRTSAKGYGVVKRALIICAMALSLLLGSWGCSSDKPGPDRGAGENIILGQDDPVALMKKFRQAIADNDEQAFLECCWPKSSDWQEAQVVLLKSSRSQIDLKKALIDVNGPDAWSDFVAAARAVSGMVFHGAVDMVEDAAWVEKVTMSDDGTEALCKEPSGFPLKLTRRDGVWYFDSVSGALRRSPDQDQRLHQKATRVAVETAKAVQEKRLSPEQAYDYYYDLL